MALLRRFIKEPVPEIFEAAELLRGAVDAHLAGNTTRASYLFRTANMPKIREWAESIWGLGWKKLIQPQIIEGAPAFIPKGDRHPNRMPNRAEEAEIIARDGYHCRFCSIPVIHKRIRVRAKMLYPEDVTWGSTNISQHAAFQTMWLQFDHLLPHSRGGTNDIDNVVITCAPCNYGRSEYIIEELGLMNPFDQEPVKSSWNGLEHLVQTKHP